MTDSDKKALSTSIKKSHKIATLTSASSEARGPFFMDTESSIIDTLAINDMVYDIDSLDEEAHEQIYLLLRGFKPATFFTTDRGGGGTHFDRDLLTERQIHELYRTVQLSKENMQRKLIFQSAKQEMEEEAAQSLSRLGGQQ
jgi:hypothetical protein